MDTFLARGSAAAVKGKVSAKASSAAAMTAAASPLPKAPKPRTPKKKAAATVRAGSSKSSKGSSVPKSLSPSRTPQIETGDGSSKTPYVLPLRDDYNADDCVHCPTDHCCCVWMAEVLQQAYDHIKVKRTNGTTRHMCAKSILPPFVTRMVKIARLTSEDTFVDLGCGNGSVMFQVAYMTGARCVGVELSPQNVEVAQQAWKLIKPVLEKKAKRKMPEVIIVQGDLSEIISSPSFGATPTVVWTANLLMPKSITHFMSERFRSLPVGTRILCFDDLYPHSRSVARIRDPEAFELFHMVDYVWQEMTVEWCIHSGPFYFYFKKK